MRTIVKLIDFPENWIPYEKRMEHDIKMLEINGKCEVLENLVTYMEDDQKDFFKLINSIIMQLQTKRGLYSGSRLSRYTKNPKILEFKSIKGHGRVFGFFSQEERSIIICTNSYWKTTSKKKKQTQAFERADYLRNIYQNTMKGKTK